MYNKNMISRLLNEGLIFYAIYTLFLLHLGTPFTLVTFTFPLCTRIKIIQGDLEPSKQFIIIQRRPGLV
jgi:hypothetical protein